MSETDTNIEAIERGRGARAIRKFAENDLFDMEEDIIEQLVKGYRTDTLTNDRIRGMIGELSRIRQYRELLEAAIQRGVIAAEKELGTDG